MSADEFLKVQRDLEDVQVPRRNASEGVGAGYRHGEGCPDCRVGR
jgi:hypothetical protein